MRESYRFGIEEEYFLADRTTRGTPRRSAAAFHEAAKARLPAAERELLQSQVEVATPPSASFADAAATLRGLRNDLAAIGRETGILVFAAGTHPLARWARQQYTAAERYKNLMRELRILGRRNVVCGMHVHVEVPEPEQRIDLMNRLLPTMPLLLALSASSPFWQGRPSGMMSYRLSAFGEMPRSGLPDLFAGPADYARYLEVMVRAGAIKDATFLWWALRPSARYPTLELRVADSCTRVEHSIAIAALYRCLVRFCNRRRDWNRRMTGAARAIAAENLWRAQRDGIRAELIEFASGTAVPLPACLDAMLELVAEDADALGCVAEIESARTIIAEGTSADRQLAVYGDAPQRGLNNGAALAGVVDWLAEATAGSGA